MIDKDLTTSPINTPNTVPDDPERTVATPHFLDEEVVVNAQPAVPLSEIRRKRTWPTPIIVAALLFGLAVGAFGSMLFMRERSDSRQPTASAQTAQQPPVQAQAEEVPASIPLETKEQSAQPDVQQQQKRAADSAQAKSDTQEEVREIAKPEVAVAPSNEDWAALRGALGEWVAATNARDINKQMSFYNPTVNAFYLSRNTSREEVRAEKTRVFQNARSIDIRAAEPQIRVSPDGTSATMRFRKSYAIEGGGQDRRGAVVQELRWKRVGNQWRIVSERDVKVLEK
jgi:ketosteroid isomerase-like protein